MDEQRVALRLAVHEFGKWLRNRLLAGLRQQSLDLVGRQSAQVHAATLLARCSSVSAADKRMGAIDLHVAVGADDQQPCAVQVASQVEQQVERAAVGVVQVFEYHQQRAAVQRHCAASQWRPAAAASDPLRGRQVAAA